MADNQDATIRVVRALARHYIELQNEVMALKMLLQDKMAFSEEEYQQHLQDVRAELGQLVKEQHTTMGQ